MKGLRSVTGLTVCMVLFDPNVALLRQVISAARRAVRGAGLPCEFIFVQNGGHSLEVDKLTRFDGARVLTSGSNAGFGRAMNWAVAEAKTSYCLLLNPDATLDSGAVRALIDALPNERRALVSPVMRSSGRVQVDAMTLWYSSAGRVLTRARKRRAIEKRMASSAEVPVEKVSGGALAAHTDHLRDLGPFDDRFFLYGEDADLSIRAAAAGYELIACAQAGIEHVGGESAARHGHLVEAARQDAALRLAAYHRPYLVALALRIEALLVAWAGMTLGSRTTSGSSAVRMARLPVIRRWGVRRDVPRFSP